jgi:hypothetical protein
MASHERKNNTYSDESVLGLELLLALLVIVDHAETLAGSTSELGLQSENDDSLLVSLVQGGELLGELISGQVGSGGVEDRKDELLSVEESVGDELGGSEGDGSLGVLRVSRAGLTKRRPCRLLSLSLSPIFPCDSLPQSCSDRTIERL